MIKKIIPIAFIILIVGIFYFLRQQKEEHLTSSPQPSQSQHVDVDKLEINGLKVVGLPRGKEKAILQNLKVSNRQSEEWKPSLEKALIAQGGTNVKDMKIEKIDSFIWNENGIALYVESVKITLKNQQNHSVSFNALVDSQTGKILKNWNQPVIDSDPRENFKVRIDPRYHND